MSGSSELFNPWSQVCNIGVPTYSTSPRDVADTYHTEPRIT